jgi:hypothetical protein
MRQHGWRVLVSARGVLRTEGFQYALDNGAWTAFQCGEPFDADAFVSAYAKLGDGADFVVAPDIVAGGRDSLEMSRAWLPKLTTARRVLIGVQDGMLPTDLDDLVSDRVGVFLGGSTEWKLSNAMLWGQWCRAKGIYYHVARVNSMKRIRLCQESGAHSFDGTSVSRYSKSIGKLTRAVSQMHLLEAKK